MRKTTITMIMSIATNQRSQSQPKKRRKTRSLRRNSSGTSTSSFRQTPAGSPNLTSLSFFSSPILASPRYSTLLSALLPMRLT